MLHISKIPFLFRFVRSTHLNENYYPPTENISNQLLLEEDLFSYQEKRGAMEEYVSFTWVSHDINPDNILDFLSNIYKKRGGKFPKKCGLVIINSIEALSEINSSEKIICFCCVEKNCFCKEDNKEDDFNLIEDNSIHHGLFYDFENELHCLEVSVSLRELSSFYILDEDHEEGKPPPLHRNPLQIN